MVHKNQTVRRKKQCLKERIRFKYLNKNLMSTLNNPSNDDTKSSCPQL